MAYDCDCVSVDVATRGGKVILSTGSNSSLGSFAVMANAGCEVCGGTGECPEMPEWAACDGCGENEDALLKAFHDGEVLCANCVIRKNNEIPYPYSPKRGSPEVEAKVWRLMGEVGKAIQDDGHITYNFYPKHPFVRPAVPESEIKAAVEIVRANMPPDVELIYHERKSG